MLTEEQLNRVVTAADAQKAGFCARGQKRLWDAHPEHTGGASYLKFIREGLTVREVLASENPYALTFIKRMFAREGVEVDL